MLYFMVVLIFCKVTYVRGKNAGSAIFNSGQVFSNCWSRDDIAKLQARKAYEDIIPPLVNPEKINNRYIKDTLKYFQNALRSVHRGIDNHTAEILQEALCDTIGAHLNKDILPAVRFAYYAGYIPYDSARQVQDLFEKIKRNLNTQGVGWKRPTRAVWSQWSHLTLAKITIGTGKLLDPCSCLITKRDINNCIHLPSPKLDDPKNPSSIDLPFKRKGLVSLMSPNAENILLKYYTTASRCILHSSPANCRHADFVNLNNGLWHWMKRDVAPHLVDEKLYTAYGGVLRIAAAVQNYGKGLSRRNLFEYQDAWSTWNPWKTLTQSYIYINADWSPALYVAAVFCIAVIICFLQVLYNYLFGDVIICRCRRKPRSYVSQELAYSSIDNNFPSAIPEHLAMYSNKQVRKKLSRSDLSTKGSMPHKVFDLNDNTEKIMSIKMCSSENSDEDTSISKTDTDDEEDRDRKPQPNTNKPKSPPKLETPIAQLTIDKQRTPRSKKVDSKPMFSTSTLTRSDEILGDEQKLSESLWSSGSSTSGKSVSSSSKSRSQRPRRSRDISWARSYILRHSQRGEQYSATDLDGQSNIPPSSRR